MLRRLMRRAIVQGRRIGIEPGFLPRYAQVVRDTMGAALPRAARAGRHDRHVAARPRRRRSTARSSRACGCSRTSSSGRRPSGAEGIGADEAFRLHDTFGFPFDLTLELAAERGVGVDEQGFESLMEEQRVRARASAGREGGEDAREKLRAFATSAGAPSIFTGYETTEQATAVASRRRTRTAACWRSSSSPRSTRPAAARCTTRGVIECEDGGCSAKVVDVVRLGDDQALVLEPDEGRAARRRARATRAWTAARGARPSATTPRRTCCTRRCASASARTCARPAPTSARTSCASTSPTARR